MLLKKKEEAAAREKESEAEEGAKAAGVVNDLVTRVLSRSAELRRSRAETTSDFFRQEVERLGSELPSIR